MLVENEAYRNECTRLRNQLEQTLQLSAAIQQEALSREGESATETFKRDAEPLLNLTDPKREKLER